MVNKVIKVIKYPRKVLLFLSRFLESMGCFDKISDERWISIRYWLRMGKFPNLQNPVTYTEKLQWLKLHNRTPFYTQLVDKYEVKKYVKDKIGEQYIIPTLGIWERFEDIDFNMLPEKFVLKTTHDSGGIVICKNRAKFDVSRARTILMHSLRQNYYLRKGREWPYKNVKPRIMAEKYMEDQSTKELRDYKFFVFEGEVKALFVATDRQKTGEEVKFDYFDADFNRLDIITVHPHAQVCIERPICFLEMKQLAIKLAEDIPHVRVDLYEVDGKVYFGEMTFFHFSGSTPFTPASWDEVFGNWLKLPKE